MANYTDLKKSVETPTPHLTTYRTKMKDLADKQKSIMDALKILLKDDKLTYD